MDTRLAAFVGAAVVVVAIPGPSVVFAVGRALVSGRRPALAAVAGNAVGLFAQTAALAVGLGALLERSATAFAIIKFVGAAYLIYLGVTAIRDRGQAWERLDTAGSVARGGVARGVLDGVVVGVSNPKTFAFFASFLPLFVDPARNGAGQLLLLGAIFAVIAVLLDSVWVLGAASARAWFGRSPRRLAGLGVAGGVAMIGLGVGAAAAARTS